MPEPRHLFIYFRSSKLPVAFSHLVTVATKANPLQRPIDYECGREVILAVDSSIVGVGFLLMQIGEDGKRYLSRFGSIAWNNRECNYLQAKVELYGLMCAL